MFNKHDNYIKKADFRRKNKLCHHCGQKRDRDNKVYCFVCWEKQKRYHKNYNNKPKKEIFCLRCEKVVYCKKLCKKCYMKDYEITHRDKLLEQRKIRRRKTHSDKKYYETHKEIFSKKSKEYRANPEVKKQIKEYNKIYHKTPEYKKRSILYQKKTRKKFANKYKARELIATEVKRGNIPKISFLVCKICNKQAQEYHHYLGYEKKQWLDVIPLCINCHKIEDKKIEKVV